MGLSSHLLQNFGKPFILVDELVFLVPAASVLDLTRRHLKFIFILRGECRHEIDQLPDSDVLREGDILFAPPVRFHRYINTALKRDARLHVLRLFLDLRAVNAAKTHSGRGAATLEQFIKRRFSVPLHLRNAITPEIRASLQTLRCETESRQPGYQHRVHALCTELVILTARTTPRTHPSRTTSTGPGFVQTAKEYILKHFTDPDLRLGLIAHHVGKGDEHLARQFRRHTSQSVFQFVRDVRINHAKTLLLDPSQTLTTIATRCGFNSLAFFSRTFKKTTGHSPSRYRERLELNLRGAPVPMRHYRTSKP